MSMFAVGIGFRAALYAESQPRDMRWWSGLAAKAGWL